MWAQIEYLALERDCGRVHNRNVREQAIVMIAVLGRKAFVGLRSVAAGGELSVDLSDLHRQLTLWGKSEHHGGHVRRRTTSSCAGLIEHHHFGLHPCSRHNSIFAVFGCFYFAVFGVCKFLMQEEKSIRRRRSLRKVYIYVITHESHSSRKNTIRSQKESRAKNCARFKTTSWCKFLFFFGFFGGVLAALRSALHAWKCFYKGDVKESWLIPLSQSEQLTLGARRLQMVTPTLGRVDESIRTSLNWWYNLQLERMQLVKKWFKESTESFSSLTSSRNKIAE